MNSERRSKKPERWPLDHHHGPVDTTDNNNFEILVKLPELEGHLGFVDPLDIGSRQVGDQLVGVSLDKNM